VVFGCLHDLLAPSAMLLGTELAAELETVLVTIPSQPLDLSGSSYLSDPIALNFH
jgi:hypothetical protein